MEVCSLLTGDEHVYARLQADFEENLPAVLVTAEQNDSGYLADHRVSFEVYGESLRAARMLSRTIAGLLCEKQHATDWGMLDPARVEAPPKELPYPSQDTARYSFTLIVPTRAV